MNDIKLRDLFAGQALNALLIGGITRVDDASKRAYEYADAMMKKRGEYTNRDIEESKNE
jgi:hypothetical protein